MFFEVSSTIYEKWVGLFLGNPLKEKDHVIVARRKYLREKRANRRGKHEILTEVFLDESYVNKNHSNDLIWYSDEDGPWVNKPTGKGERLIIRVVAK